MAEPNVVSVTSIYGKTDLQQCGTSLTAITICAADKLYKINSLIISNVDGTNDADITAVITRGATDYHLGKTITVPADSTLVLVTKDMGIYLQENDSIKLQASAVGDLEAICSYEIIDDA